MNERTPRRRLNQLTAEIVTWLDTPDADQVLETIRTWDRATWKAAETVVLMQGIGPYLHDALPYTSIYGSLPASFRGWLASEYAMNAARVHRLHQDLAVLLRDANRAAIAVMPLKGSLLSTRYYPSPALRPMADLDLLIRREDEPTLRAILEKRGYAFVSAHGGHSKFINPGGGTVLSTRGEHPDNPRPVEVHSSLRKKVFWNDATAYDLTALIWSGSQEMELLGERAWVPTPERCLAHLTTHTLEHCLRQRERAIHWLDLAYVAPLARDLKPLDADWVYPSLQLAARGVPGRFADVDLTALAQQTHPRLRRWAESVPLDGRCGLTLDMARRRSALREWWIHWVPTRWHLGWLMATRRYSRHPGDTYYP